MSEVFVSQLGAGDIAVVKRLGKTGRPYCAVVVNVGYRDIVLTWDSGVCAEVLGISQHDLYMLPAPMEKVVARLSEFGGDDNDCDVKGF